MNISLLWKWWWKLGKEDGLWQEIIRYKGGSVSTMKHKLDGSQIWVDLLKVKGIYMQVRSILTKNNGKKTLFW